MVLKFNGSCLTLKKYSKLEWQLFEREFVKYKKNQPCMHVSQFFSFNFKLKIILKIYRHLLLSNHELSINLDPLICLINFFVFFFQSYFVIIARETVMKTSRLWIWLADLQLFTKHVFGLNDKKQKKNKKLLVQTRRVRVFYAMAQLCRALDESFG